MTDNLDELGVPELRKVAAPLKITDYHTLKKTALIREIRKVKMQKPLEFDEVYETLTDGYDKLTKYIAERRKKQMPFSSLLAAAEKLKFTIKSIKNYNG